jgi:D-sedoheptulose 7-phosphate isomerase
VLTGSKILIKNIEACIKSQKLLVINSDLNAIFNSAVNAVINCYKLGGKLYIAGNGGSAADAQHLAAEFVSKLARDRAPLPAEALTVDSSILTAIGNDYGFDQVFSRQLAAKLTQNDIFLGITTSGRSPNILRALEMCQAKKVPTILFSGHDGGPAKELADFPIMVPGEMTSTIQELHILLAHSLCESVELAIFGK